MGLLLCRIQKVHTIATVVAHDSYISINPSKIDEKGISAFLKC